MRGGARSLGWALVGLAVASPGFGPLAAAAPPAAAGPSRPALVRFHTACATCHAAECSGRLSFLGGAPGAARHIQRYAPSASAAQVRELFRLLGAQKRSCTTALPRLAPPRLEWSSAQLREWFNADVHAWFVPVGGHGRPVVGLELELEVAPGRSGSAQVLDASLEVLAEAPVEGGGARLALVVEAKGESFLLVRGVRELRGLRVVLAPP